MELKFTDVEVAKIEQVVDHDEDGEINGVWYEVHFEDRTDEHMSIMVTMTPDSFVKSPYGLMSVTIADQQGGERTYYQQNS